MPSPTYPDMPSDDMKPLRVLGARMPTPTLTASRTFSNTPPTRTRRCALSLATATPTNFPRSTVHPAAAAHRLGGEVLLNRVAYTSNPAQGLTAQQEVAFEYEDRPDTHTSYVAGFAVKMVKRMTAVESRATEGGTMKRVRRYGMTYQQGEISGPSQLTQVREITADGTPRPATVFAWDTNGDPNMTTTTAVQTPGLSSI